MIYIISAIVAALGGIFAYLYSLIKKNQALSDLLYQLSAKAHLKEWDDKIKQVQSQVEIDERDYANAKKSFEDSNNPPPSGAV